MKKTFITCLALLAISLCLFVSCSAENTAVNEMNDVAYVTFGRDSRDLSASYMVQSYDSLYWFYTAKKADNYGTTGTATELTKAPSKENGKGIGSGTIGPFSQGQWTFTLQAYAGLSEDGKPITNTLVYKNDNIKVTLTGGETKAIPVTVSPAGDKGTIQFKDAYFQYKDGGEEASKFMIRAVGSKGTTYVLTNDSSYKIPEGSSEKKIDITLAKDSEGKFKLLFVGTGSSTSDSIPTPVDYYTCTAYAYLTDDSTTPLATCTFGLSVYGNATTVVSGSLLENPNSNVSFDVAAFDIKTFSGNNENKTVEVKVAPVSGNSTTVDFSQAKNIDNNATYAVNVEALSANAANDAFQISTSISEKQKETLGSVKLSLTQIKDGNATDVTTFGENGYVIVSTYIGTGLSGEISVVYNGDGANPTDISYDKNTGIITFKTNHFSEFFIVRDGNVKNENQKRYYYSLEDAIKGANTNEQLVLMNDTSLNSDLTINNSIAIELNEKTLTIKQVVLLNSTKEYTVTINNGTITGGGDSAFIQNSYSHLVLDNVTVNWQSQGVNAVCFINQGSNPVWLEVKNNSSLTNNVFGIGTNAGLGTDYVYVTIDNSSVTTKSDDQDDQDDQDNTAILFNVPGELKISNSTISGERQGVIVRGGNATIYNSEIISSGKKTDGYDYKDGQWGDGNKVPLAALVIGNRTPNSYEYPTTVTLDNVTLKTGEKAVRKAMYVYQESDDYPVTVFGSLSTDSERTINVIDGKENKASVNVDKGIATVSDASSIVTSFANLTNESVVTLSHGLTTKLDSINNKTITFIGDGSQTFDMSSSAVTCSDSNLIFEHVNFKGTQDIGSGDVGITHVKNVTYNNCNFDAGRRLYGDLETFNNCIFTRTENDYCVWLYSAKKVIFNNCTFKAKNKALLIYNVGIPQDGKQNIEISGCKFECSEKYNASDNKSKSAICINQIEGYNVYWTKVNLNVINSDFTNWNGMNTFEENGKDKVGKELCNVWGSKNIERNSNALNVTVKNCTGVKTQLVPVTTN